MRFIDKSLQIILPTGWVPGLLVSILYQFHCLQSPFTAAHSPWTSRQQPRNKPWNTLEPSVNDPWTTREPPGNHPWTTREPPVRPVCWRHKNWVRDPKNWFCTVSDPWNTREAPVKHPWSTREWSGDAQWTCINGQMVSIFLQVPNIKCSLS